MFRLCYAKFFRKPTLKQNIMKKIFLATIALTLSAQLFAQDAYDALTYSQNYQQGTARSAAMGGAFGALGADLSSVNINPAGVGIYKRGEFTFTPLISASTTQNTLNGIETSDDKYSFKLGNIGFAISNVNQGSGFNGGAWAITFNRLNDFNFNNRARGIGTSSLTDIWVDEAQGSTLDEMKQYFPYSSGLGYSVWLIDPIQYIDEKGNVEVTTDYTNPFKSTWSDLNSQDTYGQLIERNSISKGGINCWDFAYSASFYNKIYVGASMGIQTFRQKVENRYNETDVENRVELTYFNLYEKFKTQGTGVNFKLGVIGQPIDYLRIGAAIHSPSFFSLRRKYEVKIESQFDEGIPGADGEDYFLNDDYYTNTNDYEYNFRTPFKAVLSLAGIFKKYGLISVDYEYVDYTKMHYSLSDEMDFDITDWTPYENDNIKQIYRNTHNWRFGAEGRLGPASIRVGYAVYENPYHPDYNLGKDIERQIFSAGVGYRNNDFYIDLTATYHIYQNDGYIYKGSFVEQRYSADNHYLYTMVTLGFKF